MPPARLSWAPPTLVDHTNVRVSNSQHKLTLDPRRDYLVELPSTPLQASLWIEGGRNVVIIGGEISIPWQGVNATPADRAGIYLMHQRGTVHIEGLLLRGEDICQGVSIDQWYPSTVQIQNVRVEGLHARDQVGLSDCHGDAIQAWNGPRVLRVDRYSASVATQGFFFQPYDYDVPYDIVGWEFRQVNIRALPFARHLLWRHGKSPRTDWPISSTDSWLTPRADQAVWDYVMPSMAAWPGWQAGEHADFVPAGSVGIGYVSPGYQ